MCWFAVLAAVPQLRWSCMVSIWVTRVKTWSSLAQFRQNHGTVTFPTVHLNYGHFHIIAIITPQKVSRKYPSILGSLFYFTCVLSWRKHLHQYRTLRMLLESSNYYTLHKCIYWCQCKSGVSGYILLFRWHVKCGWRCWYSCGGQNWLE